MSLLAMIWKDEVPHQMSIYAFLGDYLSTHKVSNPESVRRSRQILQENNPELRGKKWGERQNMGKNFKR